MLSRWFVERLLVLLPALVSQLSPSIREGMERLLNSLHAQALATDNPIDDAAVELVALVMQIELKKAEAA